MTTHQLTDEISVWPLRQTRPTTANLEHLADPEVVKPLADRVRGRGAVDWVHARGHPITLSAGTRHVEVAHARARNTTGLLHRALHVLEGVAGRGK